MTIKQLSLFMENKPGHLASICKTLAATNVNIVTLSLADTQQFGIVRLIVNDCDKARDALSKAGFAVNVRDVLAVGVPDEPGGMARLLDIIGAAGVNIEYMYAFLGGKDVEHAYMIIRVGNADQEEAKLASKGLKILTQEESVLLAYLLMKETSFVE